MLAEKHLDGEHGHSRDGSICIWLCLRCGCKVQSCPDPTCVGELHHEGDPSDCPDEDHFSIFYGDFDALLMEFATMRDAFDEVEGYRTYERLMRRYWSGRVIYRDVEPVSTNPVTVTVPEDHYVDIHGWREYAEEWTNRSIIDQIVEMEGT